MYDNNFRQVKIRVGRSVCLEHRSGSRQNCTDTFVVALINIKMYEVHCEDKQVSRNGYGGVKSVNLMLDWR